jgi:cytochrome c biogenesis factor
MNGKESEISMGTFKKALGLLGSDKFIAILLALIIFACILGTVILQDVPREMYIEAYGRMGYRLFTVLGLTRVFRSLWFQALLLLLGFILVFRILRENPLRLENIGFFLIHSSIILILVGASVNSIYTHRGEMLLRIGLFMLPGGFIFLSFIQPLILKAKAK